MTPGEFAVALFGERLPEGRLIHTWALGPKRSKWWRSAQAIDTLNGQENVFIGAALSAIDYGPTRRMPAADAIAIGGLWLDLDVQGGPEDRKHGAPDKDEALRIGRSVLEPTLVVDSGWGIHTWHLIDTVWRFRTRDEQHAGADLVARWYALHAQRATGWHLDTSTRDLARIMRLPGTWNVKGGQRAAVRVLEADGPRYEVRELQAKTSAVRPAAAEYHPGPPEPSGTAVAVGELRFRRGAAPPADLLHALLVNSPEFAATWFRQRPEFADDQSRYDLALADWAAVAGWTDQQIATLIGCHRGWDAKSFRRDYIERTIVAARTLRLEAA